MDSATSRFDCASSHHPVRHLLAQLFGAGCLVRGLHQLYHSVLEVDLARDDDRAYIFFRRQHVVAQGIAKNCFEGAILAPREAHVGEEQQPLLQVEPPHKYDLRLREASANSYGLSRALCTSAPAPASRRLSTPATAAPARLTVRFPLSLPGKESAVPGKVRP